MEGISAEEGKGFGFDGSCPASPRPLSVALQALEIRTDG
jgi:hypothetical protein